MSKPLKKNMNFREHLAELLNTNKNFKKEFCIPNAWEIQILRKRSGLTQKQLADKCGTKQGAISRLENGDSATLKFIGKVAYALGYRAEIKFTTLEKWTKL